MIEVSTQRITNAILIGKIPTQHYVCQLYSETEGLEKGYYQNLDTTKIIKKWIRSLKSTYFTELFLDLYVV